MVNILRGIFLLEDIFKGFRTPFGFFCIVLGIHSLPIVIYMIKYEILFAWFPFLLYNLKTVCIIGRLYSFYCEVDYFLHMNKKAKEISCFFPLLFLPYRTFRYT